MAKLPDQRNFFGTVLLATYFKAIKRLALLKKFLRGLTQGSVESENAHTLTRTRAVNAEIFVATFMHCLTSWCSRDFTRGPAGQLLQEVLNKYCEHLHSQMLQLQKISRIILDCCTLVKMALNVA